MLSGHLWIFSNELAVSPKRYEPGATVEVRDKRNTFLGIGYINPYSLISVRILTHCKEDISAEFFRKRIINAIEYRKRFLNDINSCRVVFSEGDYLPGLIVDKYDDCLSVQFLTLGMEKWSGIIIEILDGIFSPSVIVIRNDSSVRLLEGLKQEKKVLKGSLDNLPVIREDSLLFAVDPLSGQKTGYFLDQRENRIAFSRLINSGKGLDLFCYSGAWSIHSASRGAYVTGVDDSENAVVYAKKNAEMNDLSAMCAFQKANVFEFLTKELSEGNRYDFVVLDPPAFVKSKTQVKDALRGYREINANAMRLIKKGGLLATSSCSYHIDKEIFLDMLRASARDAGRQARLIDLRSQAKDHPVLLSMPETEYLKCAFLEVR